MDEKHDATSMLSFWQSADATEPNLRPKQRKRGSFSMCF